MTTEEIFSIPSSHFSVLRSADGVVTWQGTYEGTKIERVLPSEDGSRCVILLAISGRIRGAFKNLFCVDSTGKILWTAELPETYDAFVSVEARNGEIVAHSWSGFKIELDPLTGKALASRFVK